MSELLLKLQKAQKEYKYFTIACTDYAPLRYFKVPELDTENVRITVNPADYEGLKLAGEQKNKQFTVILNPCEVIGETTFEDAKYFDLEDSKEGTEIMLRFANVLYPE